MTFHLVECTMDALAAAHPSDADFVRVVAEIVSDMWDLVHTRQVKATTFLERADLSGRRGEFVLILLIYRNR